MKIPPFLAAGLLLVASSVLAQAQTIYPYVFNIADQVEPTSPYFNVNGIPAVIGPDGAFQSNLAPGSSTNSQLYLHLNEIFNRGEGEKLTIGDLASITYWTQAADPAKYDWNFLFYTVRTDNPDSSWYDLRIQGTKGKAEDTGWHEWSSDEPGLFNAYTTSANNNNPVFTNYSFSELVDEYGDKELHLFSLFITGNSIYNQIDNITITLTNGDQAHIKLIPEPAVFSFFAAGGVAYALFRRKRLV